MPDATPVPLGPSAASTTSNLPNSLDQARRSSTADKNMAYHEKLRKDLREMLQRKKMLDKNLSLLEEQISKYEASYLEDTPNGNIIKGFDNYIKGAAARRKNTISDADRVFSMSSVSFMKNLQQEDSSSQAQTAAPTPTAEQPPPKSSLIKKKSMKRRKDEDSDSHSEAETPGPGPNKRVRISFSRQPSER